MTLTGGINETFSSPGSVSSVLVGYWLSDKEKSLISVAANSVPLIINCVSDIASVTIGGSDKLTTTIFPKGPSEFPLKASENALSITNGDSPLNALVQISKYQTNWTLKEDGYVKFTALDDNHIAGEFKFSLTDSLAKLGNTAPAPDTVVSGTFDYMNPKKG